MSYSAAANSLGFLLTAVVALVVSPLLLRGLGVAGYGSWSLIAQLTGYYGLLDWGVRGAVGYYVAALVPSRQFDHINSIVSSALLALIVVAVVVLAAGVGLSIFLDRIFNLAGTDPLEVRTAFLLVTLTVACSLPFEVFMAVIYGCRRGYVTTAVDTVVRVGSAAAIAFAMLHGGTLVHLAEIQIVSRLLSWGAAVWNARRLLPTLRVNPSGVSRSAGRELASYGSRNFIINLAVLVIYRADLAVLAAFLDVRMVTYYTVGQMLVDYASTAVSNVTQSFTPNFTHAYHGAGLEQVRHMYLRGARLSGAIAMILAVGLAVYGGRFIALWMGPALVSGPWLQRSDTILLILLVGQAPRFLQSISWQLLFGMREVNFLTLVQLVEAACNLTLSLWWVGVWGPAGVALGSTVPLLVTNVFVMPWYVPRVLEMPILGYLRSVLGPALIVGALVGASGLGLTWFAPPVAWRVLVGEVLVSGALGASVAGRLVLSREERAGIVERLKRAVASVRGLVH